MNEFEKNLEIIEKELKEKEELKQKAEIPENEAKEKHQKLWEGILYLISIWFYYYINLYIEQRVIREAIARDNQMRDMFADLDTNNDSL